MEKLRKHACKGKKITLRKGKGEVREHSYEWAFKMKTREIRVSERESIIMKEEAK